MPKRIPINQAKAFAIANDLKQVIICGWDGSKTHIVTYGDTIEACDQAAVGGNKIKKALGWPTNLDAEPSRVIDLKQRITLLEGMNNAHGEHVKALLLQIEQLNSNEKFLQLGAVYAVSLTEMDFGQRSEGYYCFVSKELANAYIHEQTKDRRGSAPEAYVAYQYCGKKDCLPSFTAQLSRTGANFFHVDDLCELLHPK